MIIKLPSYLVML